MAKIRRSRKYCVLPDISINTFRSVQSKLQALESLGGPNGAGTKSGNAGIDVSRQDLGRGRFAEHHIP